MNMTFIGHLRNIHGILRRGCSTHTLAPLDEEKDCSNLRHARESRQDERILQAHIGDPRRESVANGERHGVADDDDSDHGLSAQIPVRIDSIADAELDTESESESDDTHGEDTTEPMNCSCVRKE